MKITILHNQRNTTFHKNLPHTAPASEVVLSNDELATVQGGQCPYSQPLPPNACGNYSAPNYGQQPSYSPSPNYGQQPSYSPSPNYGSNYGPSDTTGGCSGSATSYSVVITMPSVSSPCGN